MTIVKQNSWAAGEINPNLTEDVNNELYFSSALKIENMYITKTETLRRYPSTRKVTFDTASTNFTDVVSMNYDGTSYVIMWGVSGANSIYAVYTYNTATFQLELSFEFTFTSYNKKFIDFVTFDNKVVYTYEDRQPRVLQVNGTSSSDFFDFIFVNQPTIDFGDFDYSSFSFAVANTNSTTVTVTVTGTDSGNLIDQEFAGGMFYSIGDDSSNFLGQSKITTITKVNDNEVTIISTPISAFEAGTFPGTKVVLQKPIFFSAEEQPKIVSYFDSRLYFGNTKSLPMLVCGSKVNLATDFNVGKGLPAEAIVYILNDTSSAELKHIVGHIGLFLYTDENEHVVIPSIEDGITPEAFIAQRLSNWGSNDIKPVIYNNTILSVDKTSTKIIRIDSSSSNSFNVSEITKGMDIESSIDNIGIIDDELIDVKLLAFSYSNSPQINMITISSGDNQDVVPGRTRYDYFPPEDTSIQKILFGNTDFKSILFGIKDSSSQLEISLFTNFTTGLSHVQSFSGSTALFDFDNWLYNSTTDNYLFAPANVSTQVPAGFDFSGNKTSVNIQSIPLTDQNAASWDRKESSTIFCSFFESARFFVNNKPVAFPSIEQITTNEAPLQTDYVKINRSAVPDRFIYITISSDEPYPVEIQSYGFSMSTSIIA